MNDLKKYCDTNDVNILKSLPLYIKKMLLKYAPKVIIKYNNNNKNKYVLRAKEIIDIVTNIVQEDISKCKILNPLNWTGNSCYIDSVLFALLAIPNKFTKKYILDSDLNDLSYENDLIIRKNIQ
jgi:hypothetical protein